MKPWLKRLIREEKGQDLVEYALLVALIAVACIAAMSLLGPKRLDQIWTAIRSHFPR
jgi:pilus assembly protein Flp/PilA